MHAKIDLSEGEEVDFENEKEEWNVYKLADGSTLKVKLERSTLYDAEGHGYALAYGTVRGIIFTDPHDITSPSEVAEGATAILIFKVPKHEYVVEPLFESHEMDYG